MVEKSLVLIKPDAVERNLIGKIISLYEDAGLEVVQAQLLEATESQARTHYEELSEKDFFEELITYITRSPLIALVLEGDNAIKVVRRINGATNPEEAEEGSIRDLYGLSAGENSVHGSDSPESAEREIKIWFE